MLWPAPGSDDLKVRRLAFEPDALEDAPEAELVTFASPALEELVTLAGASGRVARAFLNAPAGVSRSAAERLARSYRFLDATWAADAGRPWWWPCGIFLFRARYVSDAREEELREVALSLADGRILRRLGEAIERHGLVADPPEAWPMLAERPVATAYAEARGELERQLVNPIGLRRRDLAARLERESGRAEAYYAELSREVGEQLEGLAAGAPERGRLESRLRAIGIERQGRLAELRAKYRLEAEVSLLSVLRLYLPRVVFDGRLAGKRGGASLRLVWDPIEQAGEPVRCPGCGGLSYEVGIERAGVVACGACLAGKGGTPGRR